MLTIEETIALDKDTARKARLQIKNTIEVIERLDNAYKRLGALDSQCAEYSTIFSNILLQLKDINIQFSGLELAMDKFKK